MESEVDADPIFLSRASEPVPPTPDSKELPDWVDSSARDFRSLTPFSSAHYMTTV